MVSKINDQLKELLEVYLELNEVRYGKLIIVVQDGKLLDIITENRVRILEE